MLELQSFYYNTIIDGICFKVAIVHAGTCCWPLNLVVLSSRSQQAQLHTIACFASSDSSRQFSLFMIVSIFSISEKKSLDSREYLSFRCL